jgi:type IV pilus assembly protein PilE
MKTTSPRPRKRDAGFTLVECATACAIAGVLAATALPSFQGHQLRMARIDAVAALTRVQAEQDKYREQHGLYASDLLALRGVTTVSAQGRYTLVLTSTGVDSYRATATATGVQLQDRACPALTLEVHSGFPKRGPDAACWNQ